MTASSSPTPPAILRRDAKLDGTRADRSARTVPLSISSEYPVRGPDGLAEILDHTRVDLSRATAGLPLIVAHDGSQLPVGIVEDVRVDRGRLRGVARFGSSQRALEVFADVADGIVTNVSVGYTRHDPIYDQQTDEVWYAFTPHEVSLTAIPADPTVGIGRSLSSTPRTEPMQENTTAAPQAGDRTDSTPSADPAQLSALAQRHGLSPAFGASLAARGADLVTGRAAILAELARRDEAAGGHLNVIPNALLSRTGAGLDTREQMAAALAARAGGPAVDGSNPYRHGRVVDMARELLEIRGIRTTSMSPSALIERALHGTTDFPELLQGTGNRVLRQAYGAAPAGTRRMWRASTARDFRAKAHLMLGEAPTLLKVNEHGEFKYGTTAESKESYKLATFGRIIGLTRQALVNDDLDAFADLATRMGRAAAEFEAAFLVDLLAGNPVMSDGVALFHATHGNLAATGPDSVLSIGALAEARKAMRLQKGLSGMPIDAAPRFLLVPAALEQTAYQITSTAYVPAQSSDVNPFAGQLEVVVDPRLDAVSPTAWYLASDPAALDTIEYSYLEGDAGPVITTQEGFEVDGLSMRVRLDYGAGVLDWRGLYRGDGVPAE